MNKEKMTFILEKDEDGYPPDDSETLWVENLGDNKYRIDNIPFYVRGLSPDDVVAGKINNNILMFDRYVEKSNISVFRIVFFDRSKMDIVLSTAVKMGCRWEGSHLKNLYSIEIPRSVDLNEVRNLLNAEASNDVLDYEEASIRSD